MRLLDSLGSLFLLYSCMKTMVSIITVISLLFNKNIINAKNYTDTIFNMSSIHFVDNYESEGTVVSGVYDYTSVYPVTLGIKVNVVFKQPIKTAKLLFTTTTPQAGSDPVFWEFIGENCSYERISSTQFYIYAYNCTNASFYIFMSYTDINNAFGYSRFTLTGTLRSADEWVTDNIWCDIIGAQSISYTFDNNNIPDYTTQLNTLLSQTDSVENYLLQIWNTSLNLNSTVSLIGTYVGDIKDNIRSALNTLNAINTTVSSIQTYISNLQTTLNNLLAVAEKNYNLDIYTLGVNATYDHRLNMDWSDISKTVISISDLNYQNEYILPENKPYKIIFNLNNSISDHDVYYVYLPTGLTSTYQYISLYVYDIEDNGIYKIEFGLKSTLVNDVIKPAFMMKMSFLSFTNYQITEYNQISGKINGVAYTLQDLSLEEMQMTTNEKLDAIIDILDDINISSTDLTDKQVVDQFYDTMKEQLIFPEVPEAPTNFARDFGIFMAPIKYMFTEPRLNGYSFAILCYAILVLFKVVVR